MNRVLIRVYAPLLEKKYDVWVPINKSIYEVIINLYMIKKALRYMI